MAVYVSFVNLAGRLFFDMRTKRKILILDDHPMVRFGLISLLQSVFSDYVFVEADSLSEAKKQLKDASIEAALLDYKVRDEHVLALIPHIAHYHPNVRMLVISMMSSCDIGVACIRAGAHGFLSKSAHPDEVVNAINTVLEGRLYASLEISQRLMSRNKDTRESFVNILTKRELEVFSLFGEGNKVSQIADCLSLSVKTVEAHRENIKNKLGLDTAAQVVIAASKWIDE